MLLGAAAACRVKGRAALPPGALVDTGMARGHLVRDDEVHAVPGWRQAREVVVGGGDDGGGEAWELRRRGITDVAVLVLDEVVGVTARGGASAVTPYPWGAHYVVAPQSADEELAVLLDSMGAIEGHAADGTPIVDEALRCRAPEERVWHLGRWWEGLYLEAGASASDRTQWAMFRQEIDAWSGWRDPQGRRAFAIPRSKGSDAAEVRVLDQISFAQV